MSPYRNLTAISTFDRVQFVLMYLNLEPNSNGGWTVGTFAQICTATLNPQPHPENGMGPIPFSGCG